MVNINKTNQFTNNDINTAYKNLPNLKKQIITHTKTKAQCETLSKKILNSLPNLDFKNPKTSKVVSTALDTLKKRIKQTHASQKTQNIFKKAQHSFKSLATKANSQKKKATKKPAKPAAKTAKKTQKVAVKLIKDAQGKASKLIIGDASITLRKNQSITKLNSDFIVNASKKSLKNGGGVNGAIHQAAGAQALGKATRGMSCPVGGAKMTFAGKLPSKVIVHTVGPDCRIAKENKNRKALLSKSYATSINVANKYISALAHNKKASTPKMLSKTKVTSLKNKIKNKQAVSMSFPTISSGIFKFPKQEAAKIALKTMVDSIKKNQGKASIKDFSAVFLNNQSDLPFYEKELEKLYKSLK